MHQGYNSWGRKELESTEHTDTFPKYLGQVILLMEARNVSGSSKEARQGMRQQPLDFINK